LESYKATGKLARTHVTCQRVCADRSEAVSRRGRQWWSRSTEPSGR